MEGGGDGDDGGEAGAGGGVVGAELAEYAEYEDDASGEVCAVASPTTSCGAAWTSWGAEAVADSVPPTFTNPTAGLSDLPRRP